MQSSAKYFRLYYPYRLGGPIEVSCEVMLVSEKKICTPVHHKACLIRMSLAQAKLALATLVEKQITSMRERTWGLQLPCQD